MSYRRACVIDLFPIGGFEAGSVLIYACKQCGQKCPANDSIEVCSASRVTVAIAAEPEWRSVCQSGLSAFVIHTEQALRKSRPSLAVCTKASIGRPALPPTAWRTHYTTQLCRRRPPSLASLPFYSHLRGYPFERLAVIQGLAD